MHLTVVVPAFNEEANVPVIAARLAAILPACADSWTVLFIDDGSSDGTLGVLRSLAASDARFRFRSFSRNFGHEAATTAGLDAADADAVVIMDADLQDPPELIPQFVARWQAGALVVIARRRRRKGEPAWRRAAASLFYRALDRLSDLSIPRDVGDFRLMDRRVVDALRQCRETPRYMRGLFAWAGFRTEVIDFDRDPRHAGRGHYRLRSLIRLALDALTGFSTRPLRLIFWCGLLLTLLGAAWLAAHGIAALAGASWPAASLILAGATLLTGLQLTALGAVALYLAPVVRGTRHRPIYLIAEESPAAPSSAPGSFALEPKPIAREAPALRT